MMQHILAIDDDEAILEVYTALLQYEGYHVTVSRAPIEDLQEIARLAPSLLILDLKFGAHLQALPFIEKLRAYPPTKDLPIILTTAAAAEIKTYEAKLQQEGITIIFKPFDIDELIALIRKKSGLLQNGSNIAGLREKQACSV